MLKKKVRVIAVAVAAVLTVGACSSSKSNSGGTANGTVGGTVGSTGSESRRG
jgi:hypothetical protein